MPVFRTTKRSKEPKTPPRRTKPVQTFIERTGSYETLVAALANLPTDLHGFHIIRVFVPHRFYCPNPNCNIRDPHTYESLNAIPPCPPDIQQLDIARFNIDAEPCLLTNRWGIKIRPSFMLHSMKRVYIPIYGVVIMYQTEYKSKEWKEFLLMEDQGEGVYRHAANLFVRKEWCSVDRKGDGTSLIAHNTPLPITQH